ncbi:T3SS effector HopA1 family protein [Runella sp.]|uniref:T3SS effector HopA1 family protein n=1 Tax=Runella sp. TaxID=1960881 RepID=UPI003D095E83
MLFSGYQLGLHLLNSTLLTITLNRKQIIQERRGCKIFENQLKNFVTSRNSVFIAELPDDENKVRKYLIKQPKSPEFNFISTLLNEKYIYDIFHLADIKELDNLRGFDQFQNLLFLRYIETEKINISGLQPKGYLSILLKNLASIFNTVHSITVESFNYKDYPDKFGYRKPILLVLNRRDIEERFDKAPKYRKEILTLLKTDNKVFEKIKQIEWKAERLIHFDFKFEHVLFDENHTVKSVVDWEMGDMGDLHWDLASIWYEVLILQLHENADIQVLLKESFVEFSGFLKEYKLGYNGEKIKKYLGIYILHKHYYGLFTQTGISDDYALQWIQTAQQLINEEIPLPVSSSNKINTVQFSELTFQEEDIAFHYTESRDGHGPGTYNQFDDLSAKICNNPDFQKEKPDLSTLREFIYGWFHSSHDPDGILERQLINKKIRIATPVLKGKETFIEDNWWELEEEITTNTNTIIRKNSERRMAEPGEFVFVRAQSKNSDGELLKKKYVKTIYPQFIIRPNDANRSSEDLWIFSKKQVRQDDANWIRFYFHLNEKREGIHLFINKMSTFLNEREVPFQLKLRNSLSSYYRSDVAILFVHRLHFKACLDVVLYVYSFLESDYLRNSTPKFTRALRRGIDGEKLKGVAFGENPVSSSESFGNWRARLLAEIALSHWNLMGDAEKMTNKLRSGMAEQGFNVYEMYRNPFPSANEFKYNTLNNNFDKLPNLDFAFKGSELYLPSLRYFNAARKIAFIICREAVWYGKHCTWFSYKKDEKKAEFFETLTGPELHGIALFLSGLATIYPGDLFLIECVDGIFQNEDAYIINSRPEEKYDWVYNTITGENLFPAPVKFQFEKNIGEFEINNLGNNPEDAMRRGDAIIEQYLDNNLPLPNAYGNKHIFNSEFNPTITRGLAAIGYFFLMLADVGTDRIKAFQSV